MGGRRGMVDFVLDFEYLAEEVFWYFLEALDLVVELLFKLYLVVASLIEGFVGFFFCQILIT